MTLRDVSLLAVCQAARAGHAREQRAVEGYLVTAAARAWRLQFELAWTYPRICYAIWSELMTLER